jgi:hypothetical protein
MPTRRRLCDVCHRRRLRCAAQFHHLYNSLPLLESNAWNLASSVASTNTRPDAVAMVPPFPGRAVLCFPSGGHWSLRAAPDRRSGWCSRAESFCRSYKEGTHGLGVLSGSSSSRQNDSRNVLGLLNQNLRRRRHVGRSSLGLGQAGMPFLALISLPSDTRLTRTDLHLTA